MEKLKAEDIKPFEDKNLSMARAIAAKTEAAGGQAYFVGGCVRDHLLGLPNKDIDLEIHGLLPEKLQALLAELGEVTSFGASFGVFALRGYDIDIALPRTEKPSGVGHRDFVISGDPFLPLPQAAARRDFTINAMMQNVLTGEVYDFYGGQEDLEKKIIRHVTKEHFPEDPLRVFRGAQFAARFGAAIAPETLELMGEMELSGLARERVREELYKALLKAETPSAFFDWLEACSQLDFWFPEVKALRNTPQDPRHHPEGDVWNHTMRVLDGAASLREKSGSPADLMLAALCHDLGKPLVTVMEQDRIRSIGHEEAGAEEGKRLLTRLASEKKTLTYCENMTRLHMRPMGLVVQQAGESAYMRLFEQSCCPEDLLLLARADWEGREGAAPFDPGEKILREKLALYRQRAAFPMVTGKELQAAGFPPSPFFSEALALARKCILNGKSHEEALRVAKGRLKEKSR